MYSSLAYEPNNYAELQRVLDKLRSDVKVTEGLNMFSGGFCNIECYDISCGRSNHYVVEVTHGIQTDVREDVYKRVYLMERDTLKLELQWVIKLKHGEVFDETD